MTDKRPILTLITGADRGIGFETAMSLAKKGQHICWVPVTWCVVKKQSIN